ncbi:hypothetical protein ACFL2Q_02530 [Thermodesulfobacteriota bacterium]
MSVLVIIPGDSEDVYDAVNEAMKPFSVDLEVEAYDVRCHCLYDRANELARKESDLKFGRIEKEQVASSARKSSEQLLFEANIRRNQKYMWRSKRADELFDSISPFPRCSKCRGTGVMKETCNPNGKWSSWRIEEWDDEDLRSAYKNFGACFICKGTGLSHKDGEPNSSTCSYCGGKGKTVEWRSSWKEDERSIMHIEVLIENVQEFTYYGELLTPDGEWLDEIEDEALLHNWGEIFGNTLARYPNHLVVVVFYKL